MILEDTLIRLCAPTFAGRKVGSLVNLPLSSFPLLTTFPRLGCTFIPLLIRPTSFLLYVYSPSLLAQTLKRKQVKSFLYSHGYTYTNNRQAVTQLQRKVCSSPRFPHEIGIFLGYDLADVQAFLLSPIRGVKWVGCWKVYSHEKEKRELFALFSKCTTRALRLLHSGVSIPQIFR